MKKNLAVIVAMTLATGMMAQNGAPTLPPPGGGIAQPAPATPAPAADTATPAPAKTPAKPAAKAKAKTPAKPAAKKAAEPETQGAPFNEGEQAESKQNNVNIRAQSHINSEIITRLKQGDIVTVVKEVKLAKPKTDEPARWVEIKLPEGTHVWVNSAYLDAGSVKSDKLNIRAGAGENFSVIGRLRKGDSVKVLSTKGDWTEIESPTNASGFVAAQLLAHKEIAPPPPVIATTTTVPEATTPSVHMPVGAPPVTAQATPPPVIPEVQLPPPAPIEEFVPPPAHRIVRREGTVGDTVSIQSPTYFQLNSLDTGKAIDYLYSTSTNLDLTKWRGRKVLASGEEELDERWPKTPVLTIKTIQVVQ